MIVCLNCQTEKSPQYTYRDGNWYCKHCLPLSETGVYFKEMGVENPRDPKGSTAHVRDIKNRRLDTKTGKLFYYEPPRTYFFPKG